MVLAIIIIIINSRKRDWYHTLPEEADTYSGADSPSMEEMGRSRLFHAHTQQSA